MFSRRANWDAPVNRFTLERRRRTQLLDLTGTNPTRAGLFDARDELADALREGARASYDPDPRGMRSAREVLAAHLGCDAGELLLTASTSEAYSFLFKVLCDPGDAVLAPTPAYPLFEHLASLDGVELQTFPLELQRRWEIDAAHLAGRRTERTRAILVVNPNNPTGSFVSGREQDLLAATRLPIISDEVFLDYPLDGTGATFVREDVLTFTLGGLSKSAGLPQLKLAWIRAHGPGSREALDALETVADNYLSVGTPVQAALPAILGLLPGMRSRIAARIRRNLELLRRELAAAPMLTSLPVEGGWSAVVRTPRSMSDEALALRLLDEGIVVQPGYFYDFRSDGYLVLSLLTSEEIFSRGVEILVRAAGRLW